MMGFIYGVCCCIIAYGANHFIVNMTLLKSKKLRSAVMERKISTSHIIILKLLVYLIMLLFVLIVGDIPGVIILSLMALYYYYIEIQILKRKK